MFHFRVFVELPPAIASNLQKHPIGGNKNLNINLPEHNAVLRLEVELRDKNARRRPNYRQKGFAADRNRNIDPTKAASKQLLPTTSNSNNYFVPMEKVSFRFSLCSVLFVHVFFIHFLSFEIHALSLTQFKKFSFVYCVFVFPFWISSIHSIRYIVFSSQWSAHL